MDTPDFSNRDSSKKKTLSNLFENTVKETMLVTSVTKGETIKGEFYFCMILVSKGGENHFPAICWSPLSNLIVPVSGTIMDIEGSVSIYQGTEQITLTSFLQPKEDIPLEFFLKYDEYKAWETYKEILKFLKNPDGIELKKDSLEKSAGEYFCKIFETVMDDTVLPAFLSGRGGTKIHHSEAGQLVEHSLSVMKQAYFIAKEGEHATGESLNMNLLLFVAALHDVGKAFSYDCFTGDVTDMERLVGHISLGNSLIIAAMKKLDVPFALQMQISHCILAHHGQKEWGSPVEPKTREAIVLYLSNMADSRLSQDMADSRLSQDMADSRLSQITKQMQVCEEGKFFDFKGQEYYNPLSLQKTLPYEVVFPKSEKPSKMK